MSKNWFNRPVTVKEAKHSFFDLSHRIQSSSDIGLLVPIWLQDVIPSDKFVRCVHEVYAKFSPMLYPIMHNIKMTTSTFFVPYRIILGEDLYRRWITNELDLQPVVAYYPSEDTETNPFINTVFDYLGFDVFSAIYENGDSGLGWYLTLKNPFRYLSYLCVVRDWFLDSQIETSQIGEIDNIFDAYKDSVELTSPYVLNVASGSGDSFRTLFRCAYTKDYFTTARPQPQLGEEMYVLNRPLGLSPNQIGYTDSKFYKSGTSEQAAEGEAGFDASGNLVDASGNPVFNAVKHTNDITEATTIRDLWRKEQIETFFQNQNRTGYSRVKEWVAAHFGVLVPDSQMYVSRLVNLSSTISQIHEVVQTSSTVTGEDESPLGNYAGKGGAFKMTKPFNFKSNEYGYLISLNVLVPELSYCQGQDADTFKTNIFDYAFPEFNNIGWQEVKNREIYMDGDPNDDDATFGYQPRYSEYRSRVSRCLGDMRTDSYLPWHLGRKFDELPPLNSDFLKIDDASRIFNYNNPAGISRHLVLESRNHIGAFRPISYEPDSLHLY